MKRFFLYGILLLLPLSVDAQSYQRCRILTHSGGMAKLESLGIPLDHGTLKPGHSFTGDFSVEEIKQIKAAGFQVEILINDVQLHYQTQQEVYRNGGPCIAADINEPLPPANFNLGSMGGFFTYQEMLDELDEMASLYPNLITLRDTINTYTSSEGRPIYWVRISDNAANDESEPEILYTAVHHAREPLGLSETIFYMWYLLENYASHPEIKYLLDETELYFVPMVNPDGYVYNQNTNPNGGGMWRKNRRINSDGTFGVDLNRNYSNAWGTTGINMQSSSDVYPGTGPFSEPETQAIKWLCENRDFSFAFNAHTYGNLLLFPIGSLENLFADDHDYMNNLGQHMVRYNGFTAQKASSLYPASGTSDDYMYLQDLTIKPEIFAYTPEIGGDGDGFWPASNAITPHCFNMLRPNLALAFASHNYWDLLDNDPATFTTLNDFFDFSVTRLGLDETDLTVKIIPLKGIAAVGADQTFDLALNATVSGQISYTLQAGIQSGDTISYVYVRDFGPYQLTDTVIKRFGADNLMVLYNADNITGWNGGWNVTDESFYSAASSFTDSPFSDYSNNDFNTWQLDAPVDLTKAESARITFYAHWNIEANFDYARLEVSPDNGSSWIGQCGFYTHAGNSANGSVQPNDEPVYDGIQNTWVMEEISLNDYLGQNILLRFVLASDQGFTADGFYVDDFKIFSNNSNGGLDEAHEANLHILPNPANEMLYISGSDSQLLEQLVIMDQQGRKVAQRSSGMLQKSDGAFCLPADQLPAGCYSVVLQLSNGQQLFQRLLIAR